MPVAIVTVQNVFLAMVADATSFNAASAAPEFVAETAKDVVPHPAATGEDTEFQTKLGRITVISSFITRSAFEANARDSGQ
jgi:hypothetical protein